MNQLEQIAYFLNIGFIEMISDDPAHRYFRKDNILKIVRQKSITTYDYETETILAYEATNAR